MNTNTTTAAAASNNYNTQGVAGTETTRARAEANTSTIPTSKTTTNPLKAAAAAVHGAGEVVRGTFNGAVEGAFNESGGVQKNNTITSTGIDEIETGRFGQVTKDREGFVPGSGHGARRD